MRTSKKLFALTLTIVLLASSFGMVFAAAEDDVPFPASIVIELVE